ncbi:MAG: hypothetical protein FJ030_15475 [Chloroflexi bacterium]|nr:hypothetical protein [Chloroflexota bacterium]
MKTIYSRPDIPNRPNRNNTVIIWAIAGLVVLALSGFCIGGAIAVMRLNPGLLSNLLPQTDTPLPTQPAAESLNVAIFSPDQTSVSLSLSDEPLLIDALAKASAGVARVDLMVNGQLADARQGDGKQTTLEATFQWKPSAAGIYELQVAVLDSNGARAESDVYTVTVAEPSATPAPVFTDTPEPTPAPSATPTPIIAVTLPRPTATSGSGGGGGVRTPTSPPSSGGPITVRRVSFVSAGRVGTGNDAMATLSIEFTGGVAPFTITGDGIGAPITKGITGTYADAGITYQYVHFDRITSCGAQVPGNARIQDAAGQSVSFNYFVEIRCP